MASKIIAAVCTVIANLVAGFVGLFILLLAMNGFSESDALWGQVAYAALIITTVVLMCPAAIWLVCFLERKKFSSIAAILIVVPTLSVLGIVLVIVSSLIGVGLAEFIRVNY